MRAPTVLAMLAMAVLATGADAARADAARAARIAGFPLASAAMGAGLGGETGNMPRESAGSAGSRMGSETDVVSAPAESPVVPTASMPPAPNAEARTNLPSPRAGTDVDDEPAPRRMRPTGWRGTLPSGVH